MSALDEENSSSEQKQEGDQEEGKDKPSVHLHIDVIGGADDGDEDEEPQILDRGSTGQRIGNFGFGDDDIESTIEGQQYLSGSSVLNESSIEPDEGDDLGSNLKIDEILSKSRRGQSKFVQELEEKFGSGFDSNSQSRSQSDETDDGKGKGDDDDECNDEANMNEISKKNLEVMRKLRQMSREKYNFQYDGDEESAGVGADDESLKSGASSMSKDSRSKQSISIRDPDDSSSPSIVDVRALKLESTLTVFESLAVSTILEDVYNQLDLLGYAIPGRHLGAEKGDGLTYDDRFTLEVDAKELQFMPKLKNFKNSFEIDETTAGTPEERLNLKMQKDRAFLQEIVRQVHEEIDATRTFESLKNNVKREEGRRNEETQMVQKEKSTLEEIKFMKDKIKNFEQQTAKDDHNRMELIHHLKDQLFQAKQQDLRDNRYTKALYMAKNEHNLINRQHQSEVTKLQIKAVEIDMTRDHLAHKNIEIWSTLCYEEIQRKIEEWKEKFNTDEADIVEKIKSTQENIRAQQAMIEEINRTIEEKMDEMGPWLEEKEKGRMEKLNWLRDSYAAKKIQRWWREYMVRNNLYKKKKKKAKVNGNGHSHEVIEDKLSDVSQIKSKKMIKNGSESSLVRKPIPLSVLKARGSEKKSPSPAKSDKS